MAFAKREPNEPLAVRSVLNAPENLLGKKHDPARRYILATATKVAQRRSEGYDVDLENVEGAAGERFVLMSRKES